MNTGALFSYLGCIMACVLCLLPLALVSLDTKTTAKPQLKPLSVDCGMLSITIDPCLELLAVIQYLSGSRMVFTDGKGYSDSIDEWFASYKEHPALSRLKELEEGGFAYDLPVSVFLSFDGLPLQHRNRSWDDYEQKMNEERLHDADPTDSWEEFYALVNDFAQVSDFSGWFQSQNQYHTDLLSTVQTLLCSVPDMISHLTAWYGYAHDSHSLVLSPLLGGGGYGLNLMNEQGKADLFCVTSYEDDADPKMPILHLAYMIFHEFSHPYVNPLVDEYFGMIEDAAALFEPIKRKMEDQAYGSWWITVVEHFVRASELRLLQLYYPNQEQDFFLSPEINKGFVYIEQVYDALLEYEQERSQVGTSYDQYFPRLMQKFANIKDIPKDEILKMLAFKGPLNSVSSESAVIIYPDPQRVEGVEEYIMPTVDFLVDRMHATAYTDTQALQMDLSQCGIYAYGAWGSNLWLDKHLLSPPFQILPDRIIADKEYIGTGLRLAVCLPNPLNPELGMAIYTAQSTPGMKGSNAFFHGPEDWYVTDSDLNILGQGVFANKIGDWSF